MTNILPHIRRFALLCSCLLLLAGLVPPVFAAEASVELIAEQGRQPLVGKLQRYYDASNERSFDEIVQLARDGKFTSIDRNDGLGYVPGTIWLRFSVERAPDVPATWWLEVRRPALDEVDLFQRRPDGWQRIEQGDNRPWAGREVRNRNSVFVLDLAPGVSEYFVRIHTTSSSAARLTLWQPSAFASYAALDMVLVSGFAMAIVVIILINLLMAAYLRERLYLIYSLNLLVFAGMMFLVEGVLHFVMMPAEPLRVEAWVSLFHPLVMLTIAFLFREIVTLWESAPRIDRIYLPSVLLICGLGLLAVPLGFSDSLKPWLWKLFLVEMAINIGLATWLSIRGNRGARFYLLAFGALLLGGVFSILGNLGWLPDPALGPVMPLIGSLLHMVLMQMTVNDRVLAAKRAYDLAREQALAAERRATEGLNREVAQRTQALEAALASEHRVAEQQRLFVRLISHEFRTPLAVIDASARSIAMLPTLPGEAASRCGNIRQATRRLGDMLEKCVADSRLETDLPLEREPVAVTDLIASLRGQLLLEAPEREVLFHCPAPETIVLGDPVLLQILFGNLLSNAVKYSPEESVVSVDFLHERNALRVIVSDQGCGVPATELPHVFDKFMRGSNSAPNTGLGLGLPLAKRIAELHEGSIEIQSQPGKGARVIVVLPIA